MDTQSDTSSRSLPRAQQKFWGKYRGKVLPGGNMDPLGLYRLLVDVPAVGGTALGSQRWALPCVPYAGPGVGFVALPPVGANVWVEFEGGDPTYAIWSGCFWAEDAPLFSGMPPLPGGVLGVSTGMSQTESSSGTPPDGSTPGGSMTPGGSTTPGGATTPGTGPSGTTMPGATGTTGAVMPPVPCDPNLKVFQTPSVTLIIDDTPDIGGVMLSVHGPGTFITTTLTIDTNGVHIQTAMTTHVDITPENIYAEVTPMSTVELLPAALEVMTTEVSVVALATITAEATTAATVTAPLISLLGATEITGPTCTITAPDTNVIAPATFTLVTGVGIVTGEESLALVAEDINLTGEISIEGDVSAIAAVQIVGDVEIGGTLEAAAGTFAGTVICTAVIPIGLV